jgi:hypothetical protein
MNGEDIQNQAIYYLSHLDGNNREDAWHSLVELGSAALPYIRETYHCAADDRKRVLLIQALAELRDAESLDLFSEALHSSSAEVWKTALDALVSLGGSATTELLCTAEAEMPAERRNWIREALHQITQGDLTK